jgi:hypothetical protein
MKIILSIAFSVYFEGLVAQEYKSFPMWDHQLPMEQRVNDW